LSNLINRPHYETSSMRRKRTLYVFLYIEIEIIINNSFQPGGVQYHTGKWILPGYDDNARVSMFLRTGYSEIHTIHGGV